MTLPDTHRGSEISPQEAAELAELEWWTVFGDPVLEELITTALRENRDLLIATARIEEARARARVARGERYPVIGIDGEALRELDSGDESSADTFTLTATAAWDTDLWGRLRRADEAARARLLEAIEIRRGVILSLVGDVSRAYFELRDLDRRLAVTLGTVSTRRDALEIAILRFEGGLTSQLEVRQAETELAAAEALAPVLALLRAEKENEISLLLGRFPGKILRGKDLEEQVIPPEVPPGLPSELLQRRPDVRAAEQQLIAANAEVGIAVANLYPQLVLSGFGGSESEELGSLLSSGTGIWELVANLTAPIWQGGRLRAGVEASRARFEQAVLAYEESILQACGEVSNGLVSVRASQESLESTLRLELAARQYLELANLQYANGVVAYLDVLDAQRQLFSAELDLSEETRNRLISVVDLYLALGGGWQAAETVADLQPPPTPDTR
jgi:multidrug efflux system outer membrane protein